MTKRNDKGQFISKKSAPETLKSSSDFLEHIGENEVLPRMIELLSSPGGSRVSESLKQLLVIVMNRVMIIEQLTNIRVEPLMDRNRELPHIGNLVPDITHCSSTIETDIGAALAVIHAKLCMIEAKIDAISIVK